MLKEKKQHARDHEQGGEPLAQAEEIEVKAQQQEGKCMIHHIPDPGLEALQNFR